MPTPRLIVLTDTLNKLLDGYAKALIQSVIDGEATPQDCDSLFRTLMLDEDFEECDATDIWRAAYEEVGSRG